MISIGGLFVVVDVFIVIVVCAFVVDFVLVILVAFLDALASLELVITVTRVFSREIFDYDITTIQPYNFTHINLTTFIQPIK